LPSTQQMSAVLQITAALDTVTVLNTRQPAKCTAYAMPTTQDMHANSNKMKLSLFPKFLPKWFRISILPSTPLKTPK